MHKKKTLIVFRWVAVIPSAVGGSYLAYLIIVIINRITMAFVDPNSFIGEMYIQWISNAVMGASAVYIGAYVAPSYEKHVSIILSGMILLISGAFLMAAIMMRNYWAIFATMCMNIGSLTITYSIFHNEINVGQSSKEEGV